jgi:hypothetical protein
MRLSADRSVSDTAFRSCNNRVVYGFHGLASSVLGLEKRLEVLRFVKSIFESRVIRELREPR